MSSSRATPEVPTVEIVGDLRIDRLHNTVTVRGHVVALRPKDFLYLSYLIHHKHRVVTCEELLPIGVKQPGVKEALVKVIICRIRAALRRVAPGERYITTIVNRGYRIENPSVREKR